LANEHPKRRKVKVRTSKAKGQDPSENVPNPQTIVARDTLISSKGRRYTILETNQLDPWDDKKQDGDGG
jgi:hypothetical protein